MTELSILFDPSELNHIQDLLTKQISLHLDQVITSAIEQELIKEGQGCINFALIRELSIDFDGIPEELQLCAVLTKINADYQEDIQRLRITIDELNSTKQCLEEQVQLKDIQIREKEGQIQKISYILVKNMGLAKQSENQIYQLREQVLMCQSQIQSIRYQASKLHIQAVKREVEFTELIDQKDGKVHEIEKVNAFLKQENQRLIKQLQQIEEYLIQQVQRRNMNLVTMTIDANEIDGAYQHAMDYLRVAQRIHHQNAKIVSLLLTLQSKFRVVELNQMESQAAETQSYLQTIANFFNSNSSTTLYLQNIVKISQQKMTILIQEHVEALKRLRELKVKYAASQQRKSEIEKQIVQVRANNQHLQEKIHNLNEHNYRVLLELTEGKQKLQKLLEEQQSKSSQTITDLKALQEQAACRQVQRQALMVALKQDTERRKQLQQQLSKRAESYSSLQQNYQQLKLNIEKCTNSSYSSGYPNQSLAGELLKQNVALTEQIATLKAKLREIDQAVILFQEKGRENQTELNCIRSASLSLRQQNQALKEQMKALLQQKQKQIQQFNSQLSKLQQQLEIKPITRSDCQVQTEVISRETQIRRQIVHNKPAQEVERSHSLLSDKDQSKENKQKKANLYSQKIKIKGKQANQCTKVCPHIEKIAALNEIVNFMINHVKGYTAEGIRENSWLTDQIYKHGSSLENKLRDGQHLRNKHKNIHFVMELSKSQPPCEKLIKEFQSVMEFYFLRVKQRWIDSVTLQDTIPQSKLSRTIHRNQSIHRGKLQTDIKLR